MNQYSDGIAPPSVFSPTPVAYNVKPGRCTKGWLWSQQIPHLDVLGVYEALQGISNASQKT